MPVVQDHFPVLDFFKTFSNPSIAFFDTYPTVFNMILTSLGNSDLETPVDFSLSKWLKTLSVPILEDGKMQH